MPILAVAHELKQLRPGCQIVYVGQKGDSLGDIPARDPNIDAVYTVRAGKFRRYHSEGLKQLLDVKTMALNLRDAMFVLVGTFQSYRLLRRIRPHVVFTRGGFVSVPVALAAAALKIPYITHDSDAIPSLANRIIARWASRHAVALPKEVYPYPQSKTVEVGVPISHMFHVPDAAEMGDLRRRMGLTEGQKSVLVTGGGLGAQRLNDAVIAVAPELLHRYPGLRLYHLSGRSLEDAVNKQYDSVVSPDRRKDVQVIGFTESLHEYSAVADIVVARAGGNSMAEMAAQAKACIIVPNPILTGGHQTKNARVLADRQAIRVVDEQQLREDPQALLPEICRLLDDPAEARRLGAALHKVAQPDAARKLAVVLLDEVRA